ncbi:MAG: hydrogenase 3 maturation endopeptidase HyCI [Candidatus Omnitrophota bacterium]
MSNLLAGNLTNLLTPQEFSHTLIITVGNCFRADDGVGPYIGAGLKQSAKLSVIDAGSTPENIMDQAIKLSPERIIFIDAADFGGVPGELRLIDAEHIPQASLSTHSVPLSVVSRILHEDTLAKIYFIGIQPKSVEHQDGLSKEVSLAADALIRHVNEEFKDA